AQGPHPVRREGREASGQKGVTDTLPPPPPRPAPQRRGQSPPPPPPPAVGPGFNPPGGEAGWAPPPPPAGATTPPAVLSPPARAPRRRPPRPAGSLAGKIGAAINAPAYQHSRWGILVLDLASRKVVYERNPDQLFAPASVTKLYSCAAALVSLGLDHRFETPV